MVIVGVCFYCVLRWRHWLAFKASFSSWNFHACLGMYFLRLGALLGPLPLYGQQFRLPGYRKNRTYLWIRLGSLRARIAVYLVRCVVPSRSLCVYWRGVLMNYIIFLISVHRIFFYLSTEILVSVWLVPGLSTVAGGSWSAVSACHVGVHLHGSECWVCFPETSNLHLWWMLLSLTGFLVFLFAFYYTADRVTENLKDLTSQVRQVR